MSTTHEHLRELLTEFIAEQNPTEAQIANYSVGVLCAEMGRMQAEIEDLKDKLTEVRNGKEAKQN